VSIVPRWFKILTIMNVSADSQPTGALIGAAIDVQHQHSLRLGHLRGLQRHEIQTSGPHDSNMTG
jgi:hypothetical protein